MDDARHIGFVELDMALDFKGGLAHGASGVARARIQSATAYIVSGKPVAWRLISGLYEFRPKRGKSEFSILEAVPNPFS
jgi:hypothetical protein